MDVFPTFSFSIFRPPLRLTACVRGTENRRKGKRKEIYKLMNKQMTLGPLLSPGRHRCACAPLINGQLIEAIRHRPHLKA